MKSKNLASLPQQPSTAGSALGSRAPRRVPLSPALDEMAARLACIWFAATKDAVGPLFAIMLLDLCTEPVPSLRSRDAATNDWRVGEALNC